MTPNDLITYISDGFDYVGNQIALLFSTFMNTPIEDMLTSIPHLLLLSMQVLGFVLMLYYVGVWWKKLMEMAAKRKLDRQ